MTTWIPTLTQLRRQEPQYAGGNENTHDGITEEMRAACMTACLRQRHEAAFFLFRWCKMAAMTAPSFSVASGATLCGGAGVVPVVVPVVLLVGAGGICILALQHEMASSRAIR